MYEEPWYEGREILLMTIAKNQYRSKRGQKGEAELLLFGIAVLVCTLISGSIWLLGWIHDTKDGKVAAAHAARMAKRNKGPFIPRPDPAEYFVHCDNSLFTPLNTHYSCSVLPESYGELSIDVE